MNDLPQSKYDENGRPIKGKKRRDYNQKRNSENTFLGEQTIINTESYNTKKKLTSSQIGLIMLIFLPFFGLLVYSLYDDFLAEGISKNLLLIIIVPLAIYFRFKFDDKRIDTDEVFFREESNEDLNDVMDEDLLKETDFDGEKADRIIQKFNK